MRVRKTKRKQSIWIVDLGCEHMPSVIRTSLQGQVLQLISVDLKTEMSEEMKQTAKKCNICEW